MGCIVMMMMMMMMMMKGCQMDDKWCVLSTLWNGIIIVVAMLQHRF